MIKIAFLVYDISLTGGAERVTLNLAKEFSFKYKVYLISVFNEKKYQVSDNYDFFIVNDKTVKIPCHILKLSKQIKKYLLYNDIDILVAITAGVNELAYLATRRIKTKMIYCEHSNLENKTYGKKHQLRQLLGAKKADLVITLTERDKNNFIKMYHLKNKVIAIPNWYTPSKNNKKYNVNSKKIISVGRLEKVKGYDLLVKSAIGVFMKHPDWHWDIYGDGTYREALEKLIERAGLTNFITLKGNVGDVNKIYNDYAFLVMTSYYEGFPLSLLEAQANNLPIISFNCPTGPDEIVLDDENGFVVDAYDTQMMGNKIIELIENKDKRVLFSSNAKKKLLKYCKDDILNMWYNVIDKLIK